MDKKLVCFYSGWCEADPADVKMQSTITGVVKTAQEWLDDGVNFEDLVLYSFADLIKVSTDGEYEDLTIRIEDE